MIYPISAVHRYDASAHKIPILRISWLSLPIYLTSCIYMYMYNVHIMYNVVMNIDQSTIYDIYMI